MNRLTALLILAACCAFSAVKAAAGDGVVRGRVVITKTLTKKRVLLPAYQLRGVTLAPRGREQTPPDASELSELARIVIYLEGPQMPPATPGKSTLIQMNRQFEPEVTVVGVGSTVSFPNADLIFHNVFSLSKVKRFDLGFYPAGQTRSVKFDRPGIVQVYCHLHADMSAAILVLPTAAWTRLAPDGSFSLSGIPPGTYEIVAWHRAAGFFRQHVTVKQGETPSLQFLIPFNRPESDLPTATASGQ